MGVEIVGEIFGRVARAIFGSRNERLVRAYQETVEKINALEPEFQRLTDEALRAKTDELRSRLPCDEIAKACRASSKRIAAATDQQEQKRLRTELRGLINGYLDPLLPEAFAVAREVAKRTVWLGHAEAPADYHPEFQERIRQAMRGEASLLDSSTGKPIETFGLYGMRPYDVQLIGAMVLHEGKIAEMATGEGKTLVASLATYLNALSGRPVHIVSTNDYLVRVGREWNAPIFRRLGLSVGAIQAGMDSRERKPQYACDITYGTNNEFGFDYLRDNMKTSRAEQVQGELAYAIVDECDSVLVDEARTPLIISGPAFGSEQRERYETTNWVAQRLKDPRTGYREDEEPDKGGDPEADYLVRHKERQCPLRDKGREQAKRLVKEKLGRSLNPGEFEAEWTHDLDQSLRAKEHYELDKEYVVHGEDVIIVDEFTGRLMPGRQWSDGLHQAVEAKEGIRIKEETQTLATITLQNFFRMYDKLAGMTGTAMTEAEEFHKIYDLDVVQVPTNRPLSRVGHTDLVFRTEKEKFEAIVEEIKDYHERGRPVLVGTTSIEKNELLSRMLERTHGIPHKVLNAKHHEKEAEIVAVAGQQHVGRDGNPKGNITVATNMAGRGTDIKLGPGVVNPTCFGPWDVSKQTIPSDFGHKCCVGCPEYDPRSNCAHCFKPKADPAFPKRGRTECKKDPPCGLHVIGTERHEARRIDNQLRGRSGRQGDPGGSRFFLSLEDDLMRIFARDWVSGALQKLGMEEGMALEHRWLTRGIENAQKKVEERNFGYRKHLLKYDEVMDRQRKIFYGRRQRVLEADDLAPHVELTYHQIIDILFDPQRSMEDLAEALERWCAETLRAPVAIRPESLSAMGPEEIRELLRREAVALVESQTNSFLEDVAPEEEFEDRPEEEPHEEEGERSGEGGIDSLVAWAESAIGVRLAPSEIRGAPASNIGDLVTRAYGTRLRARLWGPVEALVDQEASGEVGDLVRWAQDHLDATFKPGKGGQSESTDLKHWLIARLVSFSQERGCGKLDAAALEGASPQDVGPLCAALIRCWAKLRLNLAAEASDVEGVPQYRLAKHLKSRAEEWAIAQWNTRFAEFEAHAREENWEADLRDLSQWVAKKLKVPLDPSEARHRSLQGIRQLVLSRIRERIHQFVFGPFDDLLAGWRGPETLAHWASRKFAVECSADHFLSLDCDEAAQAIWTSLGELAVRGVKPASDLREKIRQSCVEMSARTRRCERFLSGIRSALGPLAPELDSTGLEFMSAPMVEAKAVRSAYLRFVSGLAAPWDHEALRREVRRIHRTTLRVLRETWSVDASIADIREWVKREWGADVPAEPLYACLKPSDTEATKSILRGMANVTYRRKRLTYPIERVLARGVRQGAGAPHSPAEYLARWARVFYGVEVKPEELFHPQEDLTITWLLSRVTAAGISLPLAEAVKRVVDAAWPLPDEAFKVAEDVPSPELDPARWNQLNHEIQDVFATFRVLPCALHRKPTGELCVLPDKPLGGATYFFVDPASPNAAKAGLIEWLTRETRAFERPTFLYAYDNPWKEHLLVMDRLRESIGLRGYAEKQPINEFKREGFEAFEKMVESIGEHFTSFFLQMHGDPREGVAQLWARQYAGHAEPASAYEAQQRAALEAHQQGRMAEEGQTVKQIVGGQPKVGRNDPCPCDSGKKYKKCCGRRG